MTRRPYLQRTLVAATALSLAVVAGGCSGGDNADGGARTTESATAETSLRGVTLDVRNDPGCGCCASWAEYVTEHGATVEVEPDPERDAFRESRGIPDEAASCHTAVVDGYAIEGHVPVGAIRRLLADRPDAAGLALPGMPADGPGMGGDETTWEAQPVMLVGNDGSMTAFDYS